MAILTKNYSGTAIRIVTPCVVDAVRYVKTSNEKERVSCSTALWDTGASVSVISSRIAEELHLVPTGVSYVSGFDGRRIKRNTYRIDLELTPDIKIGFVEVVESPMIAFDFLIGMDVISLGRLNIDNLSSSGTLFSFEM